MLMKVVLYGHLRKKFGRSFSFDVETVSETVAALCANLKGFKEHLINHSEPGYRIRVGNNMLMSVEELGLCALKGGVVKIMPVITGAGEGDGKAIGQIIIGIVLVVAAFFTWGQSLWGFSAMSVSAVASAVGGLGAGMILSGASSLLSPVPINKIDGDAINSKNSGFSNAPRTASQGYRVPICYGTNMLEGIPISVKLTVRHNAG